MTDGQFRIEVFPAGEIVTALGMVDAVQKLPANYKAAIEAATATVNSWMLAKYDHDRRR